MTDNQPAPGRDEIMVAVPAARTVCHSRGHARLGVLAGAVVTFGELGASAWGQDALWPGCWAQSFAMCPECWQVTRQVAQACRPAVAITGTTATPAG